MKTPIYSPNLQCKTDLSLATQHAAKAVALRGRRPAPHSHRAARAARVTRGPYALYTGLHSLTAHSLRSVRIVIRVYLLCDTGVSSPGRGRWRCEGRPPCPTTHQIKPYRRRTETANVRAPAASLARLNRPREADGCTATARVRVKPYRRRVNPSALRSSSAASPRPAAAPRLGETLKKTWRALRLVSASPPSRIGRTTPVSRRPHPQRTLHKDRKGGGLFLFTHLTVQSAPFLFLVVCEFEAALLTALRLACRAGSQRPFGGHRS